MADEMASEKSAEGALRRLDTGVAHSARVYNYWLGGKDNFAADRAVGDMVIRSSAAIVESVQANRAFLGRAVGFLAREAGIAQFLDIGTGIPAANNTHEVAQAIAPEAKVVYVDNDPIVLAHARALLNSHPAGVTVYVDADLRDPAKILDAARDVLDFSQPVALMLIAVLHFIPDADDPYQIVATLVDALPPGSYVSISHGAIDIIQSIIGEESTDETLNSMNRSMAEDIVPRTHAAVARFFDGLELVPPGIAPVSAWPATVSPGRPAGLWGGVAVKR